MVRYDEVLNDLSLDIDHAAMSSAFLRAKWDTQPLEVAVDVALTGLGLQRSLIGPPTKLSSRSTMEVKKVGGKATIAQ